MMPTANHGVLSVCVERLAQMHKAQLVPFILIPEQVSLTELYQHLKIYSKLLPPLKI